MWPSMPVKWHVHFFTRLLISCKRRPTETFAQWPQMADMHPDSRFSFQPPFQKLKLHISLLKTPVVPNSMEHGGHRFSPPTAKNSSSQMSDCSCPIPQAGFHCNNTKKCIRPSKGNCTGGHLSHDHGKSMVPLAAMTGDPREEPTEGSRMVPEHRTCEAWP